MSKKKGLFSSKKFRHGSMAVLFTAVFAVALVLINIVATALSERFPLSIDLTANQDYTITLAEQHDVFVKGIQNDINVIVCAGADDIDSGMYANYIYNFYLMQDETVGYRYYNQMKVFLNDFHKINPHISVSWRNPLSGTEFASLSQKYSAENVQYGDIIVESSFENAEGKTIERYRIIKATDLYDQIDPTGYAQYGYGAYTVSGSKLETALVSAFYVVTAEESIPVAVIGGHSSEDVTGLQNLLKQNNYEFTTVDNLLTSDIPSNAQIVVINAPTQDFDPTEIAKLEQFLDNGGSLGRDLLYVASVRQPSLPNLEDFLAEWGFEYSNEAVYTTSQGMYYSNPTYVFAQAAGTDYTQFMKLDSSRYIYPVDYRVCRLLFEDNGRRTTQTILESDTGSVAMPIDADISKWDPNTAVSNGPFPLVAMTTEFNLLGTTQQQVESHVIVINSDLFLNSQLLSSNSVGNSTLILNVFNDVAGVEAPIEIRSRAIATTTFQDKIMGTSAGLIVRIVFVAVLPILLLVAGLVIYIRRKNL